MTSRLQDVFSAIRRRFAAALDPPRLRRTASPPPLEKSQQWRGYYTSHISRARRDGVDAAAVLDESWSDGRRPAGLILPYITPDATVLEIACGVGRVSRFVAPGCRRLYCADILPDALDEAKRTLAASGGVSFHQINGYDLREFESRMFDVVYSFTTFFHFDLELVLNYFGEIKRVLKPGGVALIQFKKLSEQREVDELLAKIAKHGGIESYEARLDKWRYVSFEMLRSMCRHFELEILDDDVTRFTFRRPATAKA